MCQVPCVLRELYKLVNLISVFLQQLVQFVPPKCKHIEQLIL